MRAAVLAILAAGCDSVFGLNGRTSDAVALADHDEDSDGTDDAIDVCPGMFDDQADRDGDDVGDACDPHPALAIDRRAYFSSLRDFDDWSVRTGSWIQGVDQVRVDTMSGNQLAVLLSTGELVEPTVIATLDEVTQGNTNYAFGVYLVTDLGVAGSSPPGVICYEIHRLSAGDGLEVWDARTPVAAGNQVTFAPYTLPLQVTLQASSGDSLPSGPPLCKGRRASGASNLVSPSEESVIASAHVGLYSFHAAVTFLSVDVIDRRP
ncbi:MAG: hypothetical protein H6Q90_5957 [Deltaproteobacteria bacterium]|nr:hypothetical protein [Deltaproteobacteria bacterium]